MTSTLTVGELHRLDSLEHETRRKAFALIGGMNARGLDPYVGQTVRSVTQQLAAIEAGHTSAHQTLSWHFLARAIDFRKRLPNGEGDPTTHDEAFFLALFEEAVKVGMRSLAYRADSDGSALIDATGHPMKLLIKTKRGDVWDAGHCENRAGYATLAEAVAVERPDLAHLA